MEHENTTEGGKLLAAALGYVARDWAVFPLTPKDKVPLRGSNSFHDATKSIEVVKNWWLKYPQANLGIATGKVSGLFVVDLDDGEAGIVSWTELCRKYGSPPLETLAVRTVSGGRHLFFKYPEGDVELSISARKLPHIDTRGNGGYVVGVPSYVEDYKHNPPRKGGYTWLDEQVPILDMPLWLVDLYKKQPRLNLQAPVPVTLSGGGGTAEARGRILLEKYVRLASEGNRNWTGFQLALQLRDNGFAESEARGLMEQYVSSVPQGVAPYTSQEALASLLVAYREAPRESSFKAPPALVTTVPPPGGQSDAELVSSAPADHEGHFQVFKDLYGDKVCYTREVGWLVYHGGFWDRELANKFLSEWITDVLRRRRDAAAQIRNEGLGKKCDASRSNLEAIKAIGQDRLLKKLTDFNTKADLLNCLNGVLDLRTLELSPHCPGYMFDYKLETDWNPAADTFEWNSFVASCVGESVVDFGGDKLTTLELLQLCAGYSITGDTSAETLFYLFGPPRSGKGTFMSAIQNLLGPLSSTVNIGTLCVSSKGDSQNFELAGLARCRYVTVAETGRDTYLDAGRIKNLTGNDPIHCAFKFKDTFRYTPKFKIWISSNHEINVDSSDDAVWDRLRAFNFSTSHKENPDTSLKRRLTTALEPVLLWCAQGAQAWYRLREKGSPLPRTSTMKKYLEDRKDEADYIKHYLEKEELTVGSCEGSYRVVKDLYGKYQSFCTENHVSSPLSSLNFTSELKRRGFTYRQKKVLGKNTRVFLVTENYIPEPFLEETSDGPAG